MLELKLPKTSKWDNFIRNLQKDFLLRNFLTLNYFKVDEIKLAPVRISMEQNTPLITLSWENINVHTPGEKARNWPIFKSEGSPSKHIVKNGTFIFYLFKAKSGI